jgi:Insect cuticle protein
MMLPATKKGNSFITGLIVGSTNFYEKSHRFETENGIKLEESGQVKQIDPENAGVNSRGSYSYTAPDGTVVTTSWVRRADDENGFQPSGARLPVAPPVPEH